MNPIRLMPIILSSVLAFPTSALSCGGVDLTDAEIASLPFVQAVQAQIVAAYGEVVAIESIVRSGRHVLDLEKRMAAIALCKTRFINVYLAPQPPSRLRCMTTFQVQEDGRVHFGSVNAGAACRQADDAQLKWFDIQTAQGKNQPE